MYLIDLKGKLTIAIIKGYIAYQRGKVTIKSTILRASSLLFSVHVERSDGRATEQ